MRALKAALAMIVALASVARADSVSEDQLVVMTAAKCSVHPSRFKAMPAKIGNTSLLGVVGSKLRMIGYMSSSGQPVLLSTRMLADRSGKSLAEVRERTGEASTQAPVCPALDPRRIVSGVGKGGMSSGVAAVAVEPIDVWRVSSDVPSACGYAKPMGAWWSLTDPRRMKKSDFRRRNAICVSWNRLTHVVHCKLKPGAPLAIGPTQSVARQSCSCPAEDRKTYGDGVDDTYIAADHYPADDTVLQVYINVRAPERPEVLMTCDPPVAWNERAPRENAGPAPGARRR